MENPSDKATLTMTLNVSYDLHGTNVAELKCNLLDMVEQAKRESMLTSYTEAEVVECLVDVEETSWIAPEQERNPWLWRHLTTYMDALYDGRLEYVKAHDDDLMLGGHLMNVVGVTIEDVVGVEWCHPSIEEEGEEYGSPTK